MQLTLQPRPLSRLRRLLTDPDGVHKSGGFQNRKRKWAGQLHDGALDLDDDDIAFIQRCITHKHSGGWQKQITEIFEDALPEFTGLPVKPKKR